MKLLRKATPVLCLLAASSAPAFASLTVTTPTNNEQVASPFNLSASDAKCSSQTVTSMGYALDSSDAAF